MYNNIVPIISKDFRGELIRNIANIKSNNNQNPINIDFLIVRLNHSIAPNLHVIREKIVSITTVTNIRNNIRTMMFWNSIICNKILKLYLCN